MKSIDVVASLCRGAGAGRVVGATRRHSAVATPPRLYQAVLLVTCLLAAGPVSSGAPLKSAHVSQVIRDVRLLPTNAAPRPAAINDNIVEGTAVRTGIESRAELTFADLTVTRLGENTVFSFNEAARELNVSSGAVLLEVPSKAPAAKINTTAVTAAVMGGTGLFATGPPVKFMVLEGIGTFYPAGHPEQAVTVQGGEMVMLTADGHITQPTKFNVQLVLQTSHLIVDFPNLANLPLILQVVNQQLADQSAGTSNPPPSKNPVTGVVDVVTQNVTANPAVVTFTAPPVSPGPPVIPSSGPYVINNGTVIATHPTITTNGVTDMGVLYRNRSLDGPVSAFAFGSTSSFDTASGFDTLINGNGKEGAAVFRFTSLQLTGNPTINTTNGPINLGLIAINGISSGAPGGSISFTGLKGVLLATQKGSINLGPEISFSGLHDLNIYARGHGSDLTLGCDITNTRKVRLFVERDLVMTSSITTDDLYAFVGRNVVGNNLTVEVNNSMGGTIDTGGNITLNAGGNLTVNGSAGLSLTVANNDGGHIGTGGNISVTTGGNLSANSINALINNRNGGSIDSGANMTFNIGGALTTTGDAIFITSNRNDGSGGGTMGSNAFLNLNAASVSIGGFLDVAFSTNGGGRAASATINTSVTGDLITKGVALIEIQTTGFNMVPGPFIGGGTIGADAIINLNASNVFTGDVLDLEIDSFGAGHIGGNAVMNIAASGNINTKSDAFFGIINNNRGPSGTPPGTIGGDATINVAAANISVGGFLDMRINNTGGGHVGGKATINSNISGSANVTNDATFEILGSDGVAKGAAINFNGGNYGVGGTFLSTIDGNGAITFNSAGVRADVIKVGVFGNNGTLTIGGGPLSANTLLKLYAPGSNGTLNFVANVTLSSGTAMDLAANTITIRPPFVVTIAGNGGPANIYTNNPNYKFTPGPGYTGPPGNPSNGSFGGNGARDPQPPANAPSFNASTASVSGRASRGAQTLSSANVISSHKAGGGLGGAGSQRSGEAAASHLRTTGATMNIGDSSQLLSLLDTAVPGPGGKITIPASNRTTRSNNSNSTNADNRLSAGHGTVDPRSVRERADNPTTLASARSLGL